MNQINRSLKEFPKLPYPKMTLHAQKENRLICEELQYNKIQLSEEFLRHHKGLNIEQRKVFDAVTVAIEKKQGGAFFFYGSGGTGKTYLWKTLASGLRSRSKIVLTVASSGITSLLLPGGRTAHSRFKLPLQIQENSCCDIPKGKHLAALMCRADLIIWDEAPMMHKHSFEALDRTLRDLMSKPTDIFGGKTVVFGGDFRQILPVIPKGTREIIVDATINRFDLWNHFRIFNLTENMRLTSGVQPETKEREEFSKWVLDLGNGNLPAIALTDMEEPSWIKIPDEYLIAPDEDCVKQIMSVIYPSVLDIYGDTEYLSERCILAPTNESVDEINDFIVSTIPGETHNFLSSDSISPITGSVQDQDVMYPTEFLNSLQFPGIPNHKLQLKVGVPIMLIRNINQSMGLCNGTRLIVKQIGKRVIEAQILIGNHIGSRVYIPRIIMSPTDTNLPFVLRRRQFPVKVCFAMTINKSQGQTIKNVGIYFPRPVFTHGQLYVAVSRTTSREGLKILIKKSGEEPTGYTQNIVYKEVFNNLHSGSSRPCKKEFKIL
ncbi:hypothetical protein MKW92_037592 [Papaver armeniacum]|nr:hypothetical protein MKW92_037592 [Papaver armeniacum]